MFEQFTSLIRKNLDFLVILAIVAYSFFVWWPTQNLPYYWDGAMTTNRASRVLMERNFKPLILEYTDFAHPPLFNLLHIAALKLFGDTLLAAHLLMLPFLPAYLLCTYLIAKKALKKPLLPIASTALVALTPFVVAEYGNIYLDLPMATLLLAALTACIYRKRSLAIILLTAAVFIKLTTLVTLPLFLYLEWEHGKKRIEKTWLWYLILPLLAVAWAIYHHFYTNWWLVVPGRHSYIPTSLNQLIQSTKQVLSHLFLNQYRWLITGLALGGGVIRISLLAQIQHHQSIAFQHPYLRRTVYSHG